MTKCFKERDIGFVTTFHKRDIGEEVGEQNHHSCIVPKTQQNKIQYRPELVRIQDLTKATESFQFVWPTSARRIATRSPPSSGRPSTS